MNKQSTRAFAAGIFLTVIMLIVYNQFFSITANDDVEKIKESHTDELAKKQDEIDALKTELNTITEDTQKEKQDETKTEETPEPQVNEEEAYRAVLSVESGDTSDDIATRLESLKIIDNPSEFITFLKENNYAERIQIGKYELNSKMTLEQVAKVITKTD